MEENSKDIKWMLSSLEEKLSAMRREWIPALINLVLELGLSEDPESLKGEPLSTLTFILRGEIFLLQEATSGLKEHYPGNQERFSNLAEGCAELEKAISNWEKLFFSIRTKRTLYKESPEQVRYGLKKAFEAFEE